MDIRLLLVDDLRRGDDVGYLRVGVVEQGVARQYELRVREDDLSAEDRLFGVRPVAAADGSEGIERVPHFASCEIIGYSCRAVVVEAVRGEGSGVLRLTAVYQTYVATKAR